MFDKLVDNQVSRHIPNHLVDAHSVSSGFVRLNAHRLDMRAVQECPIDASGTGAHSLVRSPARLPFRSGNPHPDAASPGSYRCRGH
jgi:hypothetical protein